MSNVKNVKDCNTDKGNTGYGSCWNDIGIPRWIADVPINWRGDATSIATLKADLEAAIMADLPVNRIFPIPSIVQIADNTAAPTEQTFTGDGSIAINSEPPYRLSFQWIDGGYCLHFQLRKSKGRNGAFVVGDSYGQLIASNADGDDIRGIRGYNYTMPFKWSVSQGTAAEYTTQWIFPTSEVNENIAIIDFSNDGGLGYLNGLVGLQNVTLSATAARALGVNHIGAKTNCGNVDLHELYATELAVTGAWRARNAATKKPIVVSAVADDPGNNGWTVTLTTGDANYSAAALGNEIALAGPTGLNGLDVVGYESNWIAQ